MVFAFYNISSIRVFTSTLTLVCSKTKILWVFTNSSKGSSLRIIWFVLTTLKYGQHTFRRLIFNEEGALEKSIYVTNLFVNCFRIAMETTGCDASWINGNNEQHNRNNHNIVIAGLIGSNQHEKCFCAA